MDHVPAFTVLFSETCNRTKRVPGDASVGQAWAVPPSPRPPRPATFWNLDILGLSRMAMPAPVRSVLSIMFEHGLGAECLAICWYRLRNPLFSSLSTSFSSFSTSPTGHFVCEGGGEGY